MSISWLAWWGWINLFFKLCCLTTFFRWSFSHIFGGKLDNKANSAQLELEFNANFHKRILCACLQFDFYIKTTSMRSNTQSKTTHCAQIVRNMKQGWLEIYCKKLWNISEHCTVYFASNLLNRINISEPLYDLIL